MPPFSFVHAADLHLDSPFTGLTATTPDLARRLQSATFDAFDRIVSLCIERRARFLLVAGDVYDGADRSLRAQLRFRDGLARLASEGIGSFVAHGNHDALDGWSSAIEWPDGTTIFGAALSTVPVRHDGAPVATVSGISYPSRHEQRNLAELFPRAERGMARHDLPFRIGVLHTNCGGNLEHYAYAPCDVDDLLEGAVDYWALGHVHTHKVLHEAPHVMYPGNPQGRHFGESGPRGCLLVAVDGPRIATDFVPVDAVRWEVLDLDIAPLETIDALDTAILRAIEDAVEAADRRDLICRIRLVGRGPLYRDLRRTNHVEQLRDRAREMFAERSHMVWVDEIVLDCQPEIDVATRRRSQDLGGEILRAADEWRAGDLRAAIQPALEPLLSSRRLEKLLTDPDAAELERLLGEAELVCLDKLETGE